MIVLPNDDGEGFVAIYPSDIFMVKWNATDKPSLEIHMICQRGSGQHWTLSYFDATKATTALATMRQHGYPM